jgi:hypothetical protein
MRKKRILWEPRGSGGSHYCSVYLDITQIFPVAFEAFHTPKAFLCLDILCIINNTFLYVFLDPYLQRLRGFGCFISSGVGYSCTDIYLINYTYLWAFRGLRLQTQAEFGCFVSDLNCSHSMTLQLTWWCLTV